MECPTYSHHIQDCLQDIDAWEVTLLDKCETQKQDKQRKTFWQHKFEKFYPFDHYFKNGY